MPWQRDPPEPYPHSLSPIFSKNPGDSSQPANPPDRGYLARKGGLRNAYFRSAEFFMEVMSSVVAGINRLIRLSEAMPLPHVVEVVDWRFFERAVEEVARRLEEAVALGQRLRVLTLRFRGIDGSGKLN